MGKLIVIFTLLAATVAQAASYYVATTGSIAAAGTMADPWSIGYAMTNTTAQPGDTIYLRGGTYTNACTNEISGSEGSLLTYRGYNTERAIIDGVGSGATTLRVNGSWVCFRNLEIMNSGTDRTAEVGVGGIATFGNDVQFINLIIHDNKANGIWSGANGTNTQITGCIIYNNGYDSSDYGRGAGHGLYLQGKNPLYKQIHGNVSFNNYAIAMKAYGESQDLEGFQLIQNTCFGSGTISDLYPHQYNLQIGGLSMTHNVQVLSNCTYFAKPNTYSSDDFWMLYASETNGNIVVSGNYVAGGGAAIEYWDRPSIVTNNVFILGGNFQIADGKIDGAYTEVDRNTYHFPYARATPFYNNGTSYNFADWKTATGYDANSTSTDALPTGEAIFYWADPNEPGRGFITAYNWDNHTTLDVDLSQIVVVGQRYEIRSVQNPLGAASYSGKYAGGNVTLATSGYTVAVPIGKVSAPAETGPQFNCWVVNPLGSLSAAVTLRAGGMQGR